MSLHTKALLFGGCFIVAGLAHTATAEITYGGGIGSFENIWGYEDVEGPDFSWLYGGALVEGSQTGIVGAVMPFVSDGISLSALTVTNTDDADWSFNASGSFSEVLIYDLTTLSNITIESGDTFSTLANHEYIFSVDFDPSGSNFSFSVVTVPAPCALALLGLAGVATRRRRK